SRLNELEANLPELAQQFREHLTSGGSYPNWSDEELREAIPDEHLRQELLAELHPRSLAFFTEPLPFVANWPDAPCAYLQLSPAYNQPAKQAQQQGWPYRAFNADHFHML